MMTYNIFQYTTKCNSVLAYYVTIFKVPPHLLRRRVLRESCSALLVQVCSVTMVVLYRRNSIQEDCELVAAACYPSPMCIRCSSAATLRGVHCALRALFCVVRCVLEL